MTKLPKAQQRRLARKIDALRETPRPHGVHKLRANEDLYRIRIGDYRVVYRIADADLVVRAVAIGHRRDVYR